MPGTQMLQSCCGSRQKGDSKWRACGGIARRATGIEVAGQRGVAFVSSVSRHGGLFGGIEAVAYRGSYATKVRPNGHNLRHNATYHFESLNESRSLPICPRNYSPNRRATLG